MHETHSLAEEFASYLIAKGAAPLTRRSYAMHLRAWLVWCLQTRVEIGSPTDSNVAEFAARQREIYGATSTPGTRMTALRQFYTWAAEYGKVPRCPKFPRSIWKQKRLPKALTTEQVEALMLACSGTSMTERRRRALLEVLYSTGCRAAEVAAMNLSDIDTNRRTVKVVGKGDRERLVPLGWPALRALQRYLELSCRAAPSDPDADALFTARTGDRLRTGAIRQEIKAAAKAANLKIRVHPHLFRHTAATHMHQAGADIRTVQVFLGHAHLTSTQVYTHVSQAALLKEFERFHPRAWESGHVEDTPASRRRHVDVTDENRTERPSGERGSEVPSTSALRGSVK